MSNIDKLALIAKIKKQTESFDSVVLREDEANALLDELERKEEQRANWFQMAEKLGADLDAAERRIAELEAREVKLPERYDIEICPTPSPDGDWYSCDDVLAALKAAGIKFVAGTGNILKD